MSHNLPPLEPQATTFTVTGDRPLTVNHVHKVHVDGRLALVDISLKEKYVKVSSTGSDNETPVIGICLADSEDDFETHVELSDFSGWRVWSASSGKYSVQVALFLN